VYPINAILIGSQENSLPHASRDFLNRSLRLEAEFSNVSDATNALRRSSTNKRLFILHMASARDYEDLARLATHFPGWPVVALVEGYDPKALQGEAIVGIIQAGASQILSLPIQADEFKTALQRIAKQFVSTVKDNMVIAVAGVTGGTGATTVALNLAYEIANHLGLRCILADLSLRMGVVASHLNIKPIHTILDLLYDIRRVDTILAQQALIKVTDKFQILAGPHHLVATVSTSIHDVARVIDTLKQIAEVVVLDVPCTYDDLYFETLAAASQVILIGEQTLPSIRALRMVREAINRASATEHLVINRFEPKNKGFAVSRLLNPLGVSSLHTVARDDLGMCAAMTEACTLRLGAPRSQALADIVALADTVMALESPSRVKPMGLFGRLGRAFANT
jgi:pilus assembly protein CpaE